ncbi:hypothetical protein CFP56_002400 [Quercus suber]|uniref:Uncharacterized protein n=1 Tax=Quercus suber TaxID=58331 RepID=A0AAW0LFK1_QUESU
MNFGQIYTNLLLKMFERLRLKGISTLSGQHWKLSLQNPPGFSELDGLLSRFSLCFPALVWLGLEGSLRGHCLGIT